VARAGKTGIGVLMLANFESFFLTKECRDQPMKQRLQHTSLLNLVFPHGHQKAVELTVLDSSDAGSPTVERTFFPRVVVFVLPCK